MSKTKNKSSNRQNVLANLDLKVAWERTKKDLAHSAFVNLPLEIELIERDLDTWRDKLQDDFVNGVLPASMEICNVLKPNWNLRPGAQLDIRDRVLYNALVTAISPNIRDRVSSKYDDCSFAYQVSSDTTSSYWFTNERQGYLKFVEKSLKFIDEGATFVVFADIAGFFENIDFSLLKEDFEAAGCDNLIANTIMELLRKWFHPLNKGLPQGAYASSALAELYASTIDNYLIDNGLQHTRYVDDIRIFCTPEHQARHAMSHLSVALRIKGLVVQTAKTVIHPAQEAKRIIQGVGNLIDNLEQEIVREFAEEYYLQQDYVTISDIEEAVENAPTEEIEIRTVERAFQQHLLGADDFDKSLFRYILKRLGAAKSDSAIEYALESLYRHPEETKDILQYLAKVGINNSILDQICDFLDSEHAVHSHQIYLIIKWAYENSYFCQRLLDYCTRHLPNRRRSWLRYWMLLFIGTHCDDNTLLTFKRDYPQAGNEYEKALIAFCARRLNRGSRNSWYARIENEGFWIEQAINLAKELSP